tara:strand:- start:313 stop:3558 length:3246 start_codon:yes stop_codon:yes gene_type:complete
MEYKKRNIQEDKPSLSQRFLSGLLIFTMVGHMTLPAMANVHHAYMDSINQLGGHFVRSDFYASVDVGKSAYFTHRQASPYLYQLKSELQPYWKAIDYDTGYFYQQMKRLGFTESVLGKRFGDHFLESELIRRQMVYLLNRTFFEGFTSEVEQNKALYDNALAYAQENELNFGTPLSINTLITKNMIWPEIKVNAEGQSYVVPVLYLTKDTLLQQRIKGLEVSVGGTAIIKDYQNITFENAKIRSMEKMLVNAKSNVYATRSQFDAEGDVLFQAGGQISNLSSEIKGQNLIFIAQKIQQGTLLLAQKSGGYSESTDTIARIQALGDLTIHTAQGFILQGGWLDAQQDIKLNIGGQAQLTSLKMLHQSRYKHGFSNVSNHLLSQVHAGGNFFIDGKWGVKIEGTEVDAQNITLESEFGVVLIASVHACDEMEHKQGSTESEYQQCELLRSRLRAQESLKILAESGLVIIGSEISATQGNVEMLAEKGIQIINDKRFDSFHSKYRSGDVKSEDLVLREKVVQALIQAGKDIKVKSNSGDVLIKSSHFNPAGTTHLSAKKQVILQADKDVEQEMHTFESQGFFVMQNEGHGFKHISAVYNQFGGAGIEMPSGQQVLIDYGCKNSRYVSNIKDMNRELKRDSSCSSEQVISKLSSMPGYEWMGEVPKKYPTQWHEVKEVIDEWHYDKKQLSPQFAAIVALAVTIALTIATGGVGAAAGGSAAGGAAAGGAAAGGAAAGSAAAGSAVAGGAAAGGAAAGVGISKSIALSMGLTGTAATATAGVITAIAVKASQTLLAGNDLGETLDELTDSDFLESLAVQALTASALEGLTKALDGFSEMTGLDGLEKITEFSDLADLSKVMDQITYMALESGVRASLDFGIHGLSSGDWDSDRWRNTFKVSAMTSSINMIGELAASSIHEQAAEFVKSGESDALLKAITHATVGCALGAAKTAVGNHFTSDDASVAGGCGAGATGAVIGEFVNDYLLSSEAKDSGFQSVEEAMNDSDFVLKVIEMEKLNINIGKLGAAVTAAFVGLDAQTAANTADNAARNNMRWSAISATFAIHDQHQAGRKVSPDNIIIDKVNN